MHILDEMRGMVVAVALCLAGCQASSPHRRVNNVLQGLATAGLACDYGQTMYAASLGWSRNYEANPVLGESPDPGHITLYFASIAVIGGAISSEVLPEWARSLLYVGALAIQIDSITFNVDKGNTPWCGVYR